MVERLGLELVMFGAYRMLSKACYEAYRNEMC